MSRNQAGFAPAKLLVAVIGVGVVAAVAIPKGSSSGDVEKLRVLRSTTLKAEVAEESFFSENAHYASLAELEASGFMVTGGMTMRISTTGGAYTIRASDPTIASKKKECVVRIGGQPISMDGAISCP